MKKSLIVLLSMVFVLSAFAIVFADDGGVDSVRSAVAGSKIIIGGDARVRGVWDNNWNMNDKEDDADNRYWDQRVRLDVTAEIGDVEVRSRVVLSNGVWSGAKNTGGNQEVYTVNENIIDCLDAASTEAESDACIDENIGTSKSGQSYLDYAYLHIPVGPVTIDAGRQKATFGNYFYQKDATRDRFKLSAKVADVTIGGYTDKIEDTLDEETGSKNLDDVDDYGLFTVYSAGDIEGGALVVIRDDNTQDNANGTSGTGYVKANVAGLTITGELSMWTGDAFETTEEKTGDENDPWGGFVGVSKVLDALTVSGTIAFTQNGYVADNHFTPTVMIGSDNVTGIMDFGQSPVDATGGYQVDSLLLVAGVDYKATQDLSVFGKAAYLDMDAYEETSTFANNKDSASAIELDAGLSYQIAQNTTYDIAVGYMIPNDITTEDDNAMSLAHAVTIKF